MGNFTSRRRESQHDEPSANQSEAETFQSTGSTNSKKRGRVSDKKNPASAQPASKKRKVKTSVRASSRKGGTTSDSAPSVSAEEGERMKSFLLKLQKLPEYHPNGFHNWEDNYAQLKLFKEHFGHCRLSRSTELPPDVRRLGTWLAACRGRKHKPSGRSRKLTKEQVDKLDKLGFDWTTK